MNRAVAPERSIAIAGGGIVGMSIAWRLAETGWRVTVFDKGVIGGEASWAGAGMLSPGGELEAPSPLAALAIESRQLYKDFVRDLERASGLTIDYQECGALDLAYSLEELQALDFRVALQSSLQIRSKPVAPADVAKFWPRVRREGLHGAYFYPDDGIVNPREVIAALKAACYELGVALAPDCPVFAMEVSETGVRVPTARGVETFAAIVIAAGAWSNTIPAAGAPPLPAVEPIKGHLIGYRQPEQTCNTILRHGHTYLLQRANGLLIAGASVEHAGFDRNVRPDIVSALAHSAGAVLPHLLETSPSEVWTGFRPGSESLRLGSWHSPRVYLAYGHYRNGILLAPVTAQRISAEISANLQTQ